MNYRRIFRNYTKSIFSKRRKRRVFGDVWRAQGTPNLQILLESRETFESVVDK